MSGEVEIVTALARENVNRGDSDVNAINNARKQFDFALNEALNYEYKGLKQANSNADRLREEYETEMIQKYKGIVYFVCKRYKNDQYYDEIIQEAYYWLLVAIRQYDSKYGVAFNTYACNLIWQRVYKFICKYKGADRIKVKNGLTKSGNISYNETYKFRDVYSLDGPVDGAKEKNEDLTLGGSIEVEENGFDKVVSNDFVNKVIEATKSVNGNKKYKGYDMVKIITMIAEGRSMLSIANELGTYGETIKRLLVKLSNDIRHEFKWVS